MRQLVTFRIISNIQPIEGADRIELATVDGWQCIVKKGEFHVWDTGIYFEVDSVLPEDDPRFEFMRAKKFKVKTMKMKGVISQGLLLPYSILTEDEKIGCMTRTLDDVLGITLWEPSVPLGGQQKGNFPVDLVPKTDQERIQNQKYALNYLTPNVEITEKLDGTSCTIWHYKGYVGVASRNWEMDKDDDNTYSLILRKTELEEKLRNLNLDIAIQGEIIGEGIQGNPYKLKGKHFYVFDMYNIHDKEYYPPNVRRALLTSLGLNSVPVIDFNILEVDADSRFDVVLNMADRMSALNPDVIAEGLVFKYGQESFKVISRNYLLR